MNGHIILSRKMLEWEWYTEAHTLRVFLHLLLKANWEDTRWKGKEIKRGQVITSINSLSEALLLTPNEVRTALKHLVGTGEIEKEITNRYTIITVKKYDFYQKNLTSKSQAKNLENTRKTQHCEQTNHKQITSKSQPINKPLTTDEEEEEEQEEEYINNFLTEIIRPKQSFDRVISSWNKLSALGIKPVSRITQGSKRYENLQARLRQYGIDDVLKAISKIRESDFLQGRTGNFIITFDWFIKPSNFPKVLEGNYDNRKRSYDTKQIFGEGE